MIEATKNDDEIIIDLITQAFDDEPAFNYHVIQDSKRQQRILDGIRYSIEYSRIFGRIYMSDDKKACALTLNSENLSYNPRLFWLDLRSFVTTTLNFKVITKFIAYEKIVHGKWPKEKFLYIYLIGVFPAYHHQGIGTTFLDQILSMADHQSRSVCLEAATEENVTWYKRFGFEVYDQADFGFQLYFLKWTPKKKTQ